jgi:hypothetical protein
MHLCGHACIYVCIENNLYNTLQHISTITDFGNKMAYLLATSSSSDTSMKGYDPSDHISHKSMPKAYTSDLLENLLALMDSGAIHLQRKSMI